MTDKELARHFIEEWGDEALGETVLPEVEQALRKHRAEVLREAAKVAKPRHWIGEMIADELERLAAEAEEGNRG